MKFVWTDVALVAILAGLVGVLILRGHGDYIDNALALLIGPAGVVMLMKGRNKNGAKPEPKVEVKADEKP